MTACSHCHICHKRSHEKNPCCPSCRMRQRVVPASKDHVVIVDVGKVVLDDIYRLARDFDELSDANYSAREFVAWLKPDTRDYHDNYRTEYDGIQGKSDAGIPVVSMRSNRARVMEGNDGARSTVELQPKASLRNGKGRQEGGG